MKAVLIFLGAILAIGLMVQFFPVVLAFVALLALAKLTLYILKERYFASEEFQAIKREIASVIEEHNEISNYVKEIREGRRFTVGKSSTGQHAHLAQSKNTSRWSYKRDRHVADFSSEFVHTAGLQVVRNASAEPIKYLMKYFDIPANEEKLAEVEELGESISRLESAVQNLKQRESGIAKLVSPPKYILKFYLKQFQDQIGLSIPPLEIPYPVYKFQYVSAGGNSSQETVVKLDSEVVDSLIVAMSEKISFRKSAAGQRALMTAAFRNFIKSRDEFTCQFCSASVAKEPNLLLEVDHIMPLSKGGLSVETNLQTLCWRCNRAKSNKVIA
jgi:hypothetical protein